ncbi:MAG: ABC transporter permease [bacterium]|nr:ABC transporter permease [bacterium]
MFDLETEIKNWLRQFRRHQAFNDGGRREMEIHLRDHIEDLISEGMDERTAFNEAVKSFGEIPPMADEEFLNIRSKSIFNLIPANAMLVNNFKIAARNFWKHKFYAFINLFGLTAGLSIVFMIGLFVSDELSYDQFHDNKDQLYRVVENQYYEGQPVFPVAVTPTALAPSLLAEHPEITKITRVSTESDRFQLGDSKVVEADGLYVEAAFFEMFTFPVTKGSLIGFKDQLNAIVLSEELAQKYFPDSDPIGQTMTVNNESFIVQAVVQDVPNNSHLNFTYAKNFEHYLAGDSARSSNWGSNWLYTYVQLDENAEFNTVNEKIIGQIKAHNENSVTDIYLQPLTDIYLGEVDFTADVSRKGQMIYVKIFSIVAIFILLLSCINFMNLSTARSAKRAKEVGLRKTVGASKPQLIIQFLSESILLSIVAVFLAFGIVVLVLPFFNQVANKEFSLQLLFASEFGFKVLLGVVVAALFTGLAAGSYPAIFLSSVKPILTLNSSGFKAKQGAGLRKVLVVVQFSISVILIIGTLVVYRQLEFIQGVDLGYNKENLMYTFVLNDKAEAFADELRKQRGIQNVGGSNSHPAYIMRSTSGIDWPGKNPEEMILIHYMGVDENYLKTFEMELLEGRHFNSSDSGVVILNEKALEVMNLDDPIGQSIQAGMPLRIVGVVKDFNFKSVHNDIEPLVIFKFNDPNRLYIKYDPVDRDLAVENLTNTWNEFFPGRSLEYNFLDQDFTELYQTEQRTSRLATYFAVLAILISSLGLFGLVAYATEQRSKEIGIRKVLGASVSSLFLLLTSDFTKLVLISLIVALPIGWYSMDSWLQGFAYRMELELWIFGISGIIALLIALATVSYQSLKASNSNPAKVLRTE